jgi:hypothetical protein
MMAEEKIEVHTTSIHATFDIEDFPRINASFVVVAGLTSLPTIDDLAQGLVMLGKMVGAEDAFEAEAREWLRKEKDLEENDG